MEKIPKDAPASKGERGGRSGAGAAGSPADPKLADSGMERLRLAMDAAKAGTWEWDLRTNENYWSDELWALYDLKPHSLTPSYEAWRDTILPEDREQAELKVKVAAANGTELNAEWRVKTADGSLRWVLSRGRPIMGGNGRPQKYLGIVMDITERKAMEEALRQSEETYRSLFDNMMNGFALCRMIYDGEGRPLDFIYLAVNRAFEKQTGLKDVIGRRVSEVVPGILDTDRQLLEIYGRVARTGISERFEFRVEALKMWFQISVYSMQADHFVAVFDVIDVQKQIQESLRRERDFAESLIQTAQAVILVLDPAGRVLTFNPYMEEISGHSLKDVRGKDWFDTFIPEQSRDATRTLFVRALAGEGLRGNVGSIVTRDGGERMIEWFDKVLRDAGGNILGLLAVGQDITARLRAEKERSGLQDQLQQALKMEAVGRLAGGVAHDFNNLLTGIIGNTSLALMDLNPNDPLTETLGEVSKAAESAASLTRQLLAFSRKQVVEPKALNLNDMIGHIQKMLARLVGEDVKLQIVPCRDIGIVKVDPGQFEHVIVNLAVNSRDAMPDGGKLVIETANTVLDEEYCLVHPLAVPGRYVMFSVTDTGTGIADEVRARMFEPFYTTKEWGRGTGLGLSMVYGAVKQAGGLIDVKTEVGRGTTFRVYLPRVDEMPESLSAELRDCRLPGGCETVLLVEDETVVRDMTLKLLKRLGYRAMAAANGTEALEIVSRHREGIDLLMTDVVMPKMNGRELAEKIAVRYPSIKVLFSSGYTEDIIARHGIADERFNFISKPFTPMALAKRIREVLERKAV